MSARRKRGRPCETTYTPWSNVVATPWTTSSHTPATAAASTTAAAASSPSGLAAASRGASVSSTQTATSGASSALPPLYFGVSSSTVKGLSPLWSSPHPGFATASATTAATAAATSPHLTTAHSSPAQSPSASPLAHHARAVSPGVPEISSLHVTPYPQRQQQQQLLQQAQKQLAWQSSSSIPGVTLEPVYKSRRLQYNGAAPGTVMVAPGSFPTSASLSVLGGGHNRDSSARAGGGNSSASMAAGGGAGGGAGASSSSVAMDEDMGVSSSDYTTAPTVTQPHAHSHCAVGLSHHFQPQPKHQASGPKSSTDSSRARSSWSATAVYWMCTEADAGVVRVSIKSVRGRNLCIVVPAQRCTFQDVYRALAEKLGIQTARVRLSRGGVHVQLHDRVVTGMRYSLVPYIPTGAEGQGAVTINMNCPP